MRTLTGLATIREAARAARASGSLGFVPTMGALHEGHLSLVRRARLENDRVAVSVFVNPLQFDERSDFDRYPRVEAQDAELLEAAGADLTLLLSQDEMYPPGFATRVVQDSQLTETLEGAARPGHFTGVLTVVAKLLGISRPDRAYFGRKDFQQTVVVRRMAADLELGTEIVVCGTVRDPDGLAMSSRNAFLSPDERRRGLSLVHALAAAEARYEAGERAGPVLEGLLRATLDRELGGEPDYVAVVDPVDLTPRATVHDGDVMLVAARVGRTRLIDNHVLGEALP
ncbi:MAG: pantoate--beta-alanine ligase [Planctomycetota bacterium]|jgi:pantoate--beta-alanine ligase